MRWNAVKQTVLWTVCRHSGGALQREAVISRSEMESYILRQRNSRPGDGALLVEGTNAMPVMLPSAELLSQWAAEELWDWRVRALSSAICALAAIAVLVIYLIWGREREVRTSDGKARRYMGRISATLLVIALAEGSFFKEPVSTLLLIATALAIGAIALGMPAQGQEINQDQDSDGSEAQPATQ